MSKASDDQLAGRLSELFRETGRAHHQAYLSTDGHDPEWPVWYADYLYDKLRKLLDAELTKSQLIYYFVLLDQEYNSKNPGTDWPDFYARFFVDRFRQNPVSLL